MQIDLDMHTRSVKLSFETKVMGDTLITALGEIPSRGPSEARPGFSTSRNYDMTSVFF